MITIEGRFQNSSFTQQEVDDMKKEFDSLYRTNFKLEDMPTAGGIGQWTIIFVIAGFGFVIKSILDGFLSELGKDIYKNLAKKFREKIASKPHGESSVIINFRDINFSIHFLFADAPTLEQLLTTIQYLSSNWVNLKIPKDLALLELQFDEVENKWTIYGGETKQKGVMYSYNKITGNWGKREKVS